MIVLVILVGVMSIAWPRITGQIQLVAPREAALQLKEDLAEAREQTIIGGEPWVVRIKRGTGNYEIGPIAAFCHRQEPVGGTSSLGIDVLAPAPPVTTSIAGTASLDVGQATEPSAVPSHGSGSSSIGLLSGGVPTGAVIEKLQLPAGMIFDDGWAHSTQDVNQFRPDQNALNAPLAPNATQANPSLPTGVAPLQQQHWKYVVVFQPDGRATEAEIRLKDQGSRATIRLRIRGLTGGVTIDSVERWKPVEPLEAGNLQEIDPAQREIDALRNPDGAFDRGVDSIASPYATPYPEATSPGVDATQRIPESPR